MDRHATEVPMSLVSDTVQGLKQQRLTFGGPIGLEMRPPFAAP